MEHEAASTGLIAAVLSAALVIGLLAGLPLGMVARQFSGGESGSHLAVPEKE